jgi:hypothetical protein
VLDEPIGDLRHVDAADVDPASGRGEIVPVEALRPASRTLISTTCITAPSDPTPDSMNVPLS